MTNVAFRDSSDPSASEFKARQITVDLSMLALLSGLPPINACYIRNGSVYVNMFPEYGAEASGDKIGFVKFNAFLRRESNWLKIVEARGALEDINLCFSGSIRNINLPGLSPAPRYWERKKRKPKNPFISRQILKLPVAWRKKAMIAFSKIKNKKFKTPPELDMILDIDLKELLNKSFIDFHLKTPGFSFGRLNVQGMVGDALIKNSEINVTLLNIDMGNGDICNIKGLYKIDSNNISGTISGKTDANKLLPFFDDKSVEIIRENFNNGKFHVIYKGSLGNYSPLTGKYTGTMEVNIPILKMKNLGLTDVSASVSVNDQSISGSLQSAKLPHEGSLSGNFMLTEKALTGDFTGSSSIKNILPDLGKRERDFIWKNMDIINSQSFKFSGLLNKPAAGTFGGKIAISTPALKICNLNFHKLKASVEFNSQDIKINKLSANLDNETEISGEMHILISENFMTASIFCKGNPKNAVALIPKSSNPFFLKLINDIKWPPKGNLAEANVEIYHQWKDAPHYFLSGNAVMTNFVYKDINFNYGATKFYVDSDGLVVLPGIVMESKKGQALMTLVYDGRKKSSWAVKSPHISAFDIPREQLSFNLESTLVGNNIIKCLYPQWKSEYLTFKDSIMISSDGTIDFKDENKTVFSAKLDNAICTWQDLSIRNLDARLFYSKQILTMNKATAELCNGHMNIDYDFNFGNMTGNFALDFNGTNFSQLLRKAKWESMISKSKNEGKLSGEIKAKISYDKKDDLLLDGKGKIKITKADLWSIPLLGGLLDVIGTAWSVDALGNISELKCNFTLKKDKFHTDSIQSNGNIISLKGEGDYSWLTNEYNFKVQSEALKHVLPFKVLSYFFIPVTWFLDAKVTGKGRKMKWE